MAYPPASIGSGLVGTQATTGFLAAYLNALAAAVNDTVAELGTDPSGAAASLTARLTALGTAAVANKVAAGAAGVLDATDVSTTNARTPTAHASTHAPAGSDDLTTALSAISVPVGLGTAAAGTGTGFSRQGHVHPTTGVVVTGEMAQVPAYGVTPLALKKWRRAKARVRAGTANAKILCLGDSTTQGNNGTASLVTSWPERLQQLLNSYTVKCSYGGAMAQNGNGFTGIPDPKFTAGSGWSIAGGFGFSSGSGYQAVTGASGALTYTPGIACDTFDIYYVRWATGGTLSASVDGGGATVIATNGANAILKATITTSLASNHVLSVTHPTGTNSDWGIYFDCYDSTAKTVQMMNAGSGGATSTHYAENATAWDSIPCITAVAADLVIVNLGINDAGITAVPASTLVANLTLIANTAIAAGGDVILTSVIPTGITPDYNLEVTYQAAVKSLAASMGLPFVDLLGRWVDYTSSNALGFMGDAKHGSASGYSDVADALFSVLAGA